MSDLHCPARLYVARSGEAVAGTGGEVPDGAGLSDRGREQVRGLAARLRGKRIATVYGSGEVRRGSESAALAGEALDVPVRTLDGVHPASVGGPGTDRTGAADRLREALEEVADLHRGESVLVFSHGPVMSLVLPALAHDVPTGDADPTGAALPRCEPVLLETDADGWRVLAWPDAGDPGPQTP